MKKIFLFLFVIFLAILLSGCVAEVPVYSELPTSSSESISVTPSAGVESEVKQAINEDEYLNVENEEVTLTFIYGDRKGEFTGTLVNGVPVGYGSFTSQNAEGVMWTYLGFFEDGLFNGTGEALWESGARREGVYKNGSLIQGKIYSDDGVLLFDGELGEQEEHTEEFIGYLKNIEDSIYSETVNPLSRDLIVHFLDVGQADSIFIQLPNGENMLIDGGETYNAGYIINYLRFHDVETINYLIASHPHADHIGGLPAIIDAFDILEIYMPRVSHTTVTFENLLTSIQNKGLVVSTAKAGVNILSLTELEINIIAPERDDYNSHNDHSAVVKLIYGTTSFLFMGDVESYSEEHILTDISADVLKVGHHGSKSSTSEYFLNRVKPSYAVISVGENNMYGHPTDEVLARLDNADVEVYRTDKVGTITFISDGTNIITDKTPSPYHPVVVFDESENNINDNNVSTDNGNNANGGNNTGNNGNNNGSSSDNNSNGNDKTDETIGSSDITVYITRTGQRYHKDGCRHLARSKIETTLSSAKVQGLTACGTCKPSS